MKTFFLTLLLISSPILLAQENSKAIPPVIVAKIPLGETVVFENTAVSFLKVIEDSRCPKDVTCVWAGEAKVLVKIKTKAETVEKEILFKGTFSGNKKDHILFISDSKNYVGYQLAPYPETSLPTSQRTYYLDVLIVEKTI